MTKLIKMFAFGLLCCTVGTAADCSKTVNVKKTGAVDPDSVEVDYDCLATGYTINWHGDSNETPRTFTVDFGDTSTSPCVDSHDQPKSNFKQNDHESCTVKAGHFPTTSHGCSNGDSSKHAVCFKYNVSADGHSPKDPQVIVDQSRGGFHKKKK